MNTYQNSTYQSPSFIKRYLHQKRFRDIVDILKLKKFDTFLDYGCGDGYLLKLVSTIINPRNVFGFEPAKSMYKQALENLKEEGIVVASDSNTLPYKEFTRIACLETCEHLCSDELIKLFESIDRLLVKQGKAIFSVPVEIGIPALLKNTFRFMKDRNYDNLNLKNFIKVFLGMPVKRNVNQKLSNVKYIYSHIGFDHRNFESKLSKYFSIESKQYSPVNFLGTFLNNTIFYVCLKQSENKRLPSG